MDQRRSLGTRGELAAAAYLTEQGVHILMRNYRCRMGEIDLIAREGDCLLVIEVKTRYAHRQGIPAEAVDLRKQNKICRTFDYFRMRYHINDSTPVRFDVIEVDRKLNCHWIRNAFDYQGII
ncbi:MAG: YraN family protein [Eubacterium sp.]|nr:YraN family protein [Eubacterium sp.]